VGVANVARILVRAPNWVGDVVMATPGLRALRAHYRDAHITVQIRPGLEGLLGACPYVDEVIPVTSYHRGLAAIVAEGRGLANEARYDLGICLPDSFSSALLMRAARVKKIVGYRGGLRSPLLSDPVTQPREWGARKMVARERFVLGLTQALGCKDRGTHLELFTSSEEKADADIVMHKHKVGAGDAVVVLAPGASFGASKCWPVESFANVGDALQAYGVRVVLLGSPAEAALTAKVAAAMKEPPVDLAGCLTLGGAKALIRRSSLVVCNDAGARHIASAFGVPSIVFFGPTSLEKTNLNLESVAVLQTDDSCRPCYKRECPIDHRCMTGIAPDRVIEIAREALGLDK
jgi:heptosyltransferase-2